MECLPYLLFKVDIGTLVASYDSMLDTTSCVTLRLNGQGCNLVLKGMSFRQHRRF